MQVTFRDDPSAPYARIQADADFVLVIDLVFGDSVGTNVLTGVLKPMTKQPLAGAVTKVIKHFAGQHGDSPAAIAQLCSDLAAPMERLCAAHDIGHLKGAFVEQIVFRCLFDRYRHNNHRDNVFVGLPATNYVTPKSVDVVGWDGQRGECHDCKSRARGFDLGFVQSMEGGLPPAHFLIGLTCMDAGVWIAKSLLDRGYTPASHTRLVSLENLWTLAPLQQ